MGLFKKAFGCKSCRGRVRQKPPGLTQLDLFDVEMLFRREMAHDVINYERERELYVRSSKQGSSHEERSLEEDV